MIARLSYTLVLWLALPLILVRLWLRGQREPGYRHALGERFGRHAPAGIAQVPVIWVHAVSVGEVRASVPLVRALQAEFPGGEFVLTCMTAAGREALDQVYGDSVRKAWLPYDYPFAVRGFLDATRPALGVLIETEVWINLLAACRARSIPVVLSSARMSARSCRGYARLAPLTRPAFEGLAAVCAQSEVDATRIASLGAHRVTVAGNLKFDVLPDAAQAAAGATFKVTLAGRPVLLLSSTRDGEERMLLEALAPRLPARTLVVVVPRHPQRFDEVVALVAECGLKAARRSRGEAVQDIQVLVGDTMGEMPFYYALADVAVIGGSLLPLGGQNLIEACAQAVPVVIGPHTFNFSQATRAAVAAGAAIQVEDANGAADVASRLLAEPGRCAAMAQAGLALCAEHRGATARHLDAIRPLLARRR